jgi:hypothetical protein
LLLLGRMPRSASRSGARPRRRTRAIASRATLPSLAALTVLATFGGLAVSARPGQADGDDRGVAEALVKPAAPLGPAAVTAEAVEQTSDALERATRFRAAGDESHAMAADGLAREWAETARDLGLAAAAEKMADDRKRQAIQAQAQLQRTKALVEESIARLGRLRAELDALSPEARRPAGAAAAGSDATPKGAPDGARDHANRPATTAAGPRATADTGAAP